MWFRRWHHVSGIGAGNSFKKFRLFRLAGYDGIRTFGFFQWQISAVGNIEPETGLSFRWIFPVAFQHCFIKCGCAFNSCDILPVQSSQYCLPAGCGRHPDISHHDRLVCHPVPGIDIWKKWQSPEFLQHAGAWRHLAAITDRFICWSITGYSRFLFSV